MNNMTTNTEAYVRGFDDGYYDTKRTPPTNMNEDKTTWYDEGLEDGQVERKAEQA